MERDPKDFRITRSDATMSVCRVACVVGAAAVAFLALNADVRAQARSPQAQHLPTPTVVALAQQLLELKGGLIAFDPAINGVIIHHRNILLQINPNLTKDVDATVALMRADMAARQKELHHEIAVGYATAFTEQELRDMIAFYKTPLGRKMLENEPKAGDASTKRAQDWIEKYAEETMAKMRAEMKKKGHTEF
jgi:hypothetical protein